MHYSSRQYMLDDDWYDEVPLFWRRYVVPTHHMRTAPLEVHIFPWISTLFLPFMVLVANAFYLAKLEIRCGQTSAHFFSTVNFQHLVPCFRIYRTKNHLSPSKKH